MNCDNGFFVIALAVKIRHSHAAGTDRRNLISGCHLDRGCEIVR